jgi:ribosomal protein L28
MSYKKKPKQNNKSKTRSKNIFTDKERNFQSNLSKKDLWELNEQRMKELHINSKMVGSKWYT